MFIKILVILFVGFKDKATHMLHCSKTNSNKTVIPRVRVRESWPNSTLHSTIYKHNQMFTNDSIK